MLSTISHSDTEAPRMRNECTIAVRMCRHFAHDPFLLCTLCRPCQFGWHALWTPFTQVFTILFTPPRPHIPFREVLCVQCVKLTEILLHHIIGVFLFTCSLRIGSDLFNAVSPLMQDLDQILTRPLLLDLHLSFKR